MSQPRITLTIVEGEARIYLNPEGRDLLVQMLQRLNEKLEHFHLGNWEGAAVGLRDNPYDPSETVLSAAKILFRTDAWDRQFYPHVMPEGDHATRP
jgi:hypothetical protein